MSSQDNQIVAGAAFEADKQMDYAKAKLNKCGGKSVNVINTNNSTLNCFML